MPGNQARIPTKEQLDLKETVTKMETTVSSNSYLAPQPTSNGIGYPSGTSNLEKKNHASQ